MIGLSKALKEDQLWFFSGLVELRETMTSYFSCSRAVEVVEAVDRAYYCNEKLVLVVI